MTRRRTLALAAGSVLALFVLGVALATVGNLLRAPICLSGGAECDGVTPISQPIGLALFVVGTAVAVISPVTVGLTCLLGLRRRRRRQ